MSFVTDGTPELTATTNTIKCAAGNDSMSHHAIWDNGAALTSGQKYWKVKFDSVQEAASCGVTSKARLAPGYKLRTLSYNGNLTDGNQALKISFGEFFKTGDVIGVLASFSGDKLQVFFDHNGKNLGLAYDVPASCLPGGIYPMVSLGSGSSASISEAPVPATTTKSGNTATGVEGDWKLVSFKHKGTEASMKEGTMKIESSGADSYKVFGKVINNLGSQFKKVDGKWTGLHPRSTMMAGPPELMQLEAQLCQIYAAPALFENRNEILHLNGSESESTWSRYEAESSAFVGNPFE